MSSGFVSETELAEQRKRRQEEWEKVRTADQPLEAPEEVYDPRSLFERLEEQRKKKDDEFEEAHKLKNMVRGLDDDEVEFLDTVERLKENLDKKVRDEERAEMEQFRSAVATLAEQNMVQMLQKEIEPAKVAPPKKAAPTRSSQQKLLAGAVIRKKSVENEKVPPKKMRTNSDSETNKKETVVKEESINAAPNEPNNAAERVTPAESSAKESLRPVGVLPSTLQCVGILPGLGSYHDSSDSERSSDSESDIPSRRRFDLLGRTIEKDIKTAMKRSGGKE